MLVLSRKVGETILVGEDIVITVTEITYDKVKIGIDAPKDVTIHRSEVAERIKREGKYEPWHG